MSNWLLWKRSITPGLHKTCLSKYKTFNHIIPFKIPKITEFERHKIIICTLKGKSAKQLDNQYVVLKLLWKKLKNQERSRTKKGLDGQENFQNLMRRPEEVQQRPGQHLAASSGCQDDPSTVWISLIRNGLCGRVAAKKPLFRKEDRQKIHRFTVQ